MEPYNFDTRRVSLGFDEDFQNIFQHLIPPLNSVRDKDSLQLPSIDEERVVFDGAPEPPEPSREPTPEPLSLEIEEDPDFVSKINELFNEGCVILNKLRDEKEAILEREKARALKGGKPPKEEPPPSTDPLEETVAWNVMASEALTTTEFKVSGPGYNAVDDPDSKWMLKKALPWHEQEEIRKKCCKWMAKSQPMAKKK